jgi:cytochrome c-type biogenesis protein CcmH/NrfG
MDRTEPTHQNAKSVEAALLARLGLSSGASSQDVQSAHDALVEFLEGAPSDQRGWARQQIGLVDEAYALLSDPTIDRSALAGSAVIADTSASAATTATASVVTTQPALRPMGAPRNPLIKRVAIGAVAIGVVAVIVIGGFNMNGGTGIPPINGSPAPEAAASPGLDQAQVAALMQKIQADPKDVDSLQSLADLYYQAKDFKTAGTFLENIISLDPKNVTALLALGATQFNQGDETGAEKQWLAVAAIDPKNVEAHYDLGFLYLSKNPPDMAKVKVEWGKVIEIDPNSDVAKTVATHLATLDASPAPSGASAAPAASSAPASAAPSGAPAVSPSPSGN